MMMDAAKIHTPVMLERTVALLAPALESLDAVMYDGTLGMGGHSEALLRRFEALRLIGVDRDEQALAIAAKRLAPYADRTVFVHAVFDAVDEALAKAHTSQLAGVLLDLGVSSLQLDVAERGFSYSRPAPLDMRMDPSAPRDAKEVVNGFSERELEYIFRRYGEEKFARRYAAAIVAARLKAPLTTTTELADLVKDATPRSSTRSGHPAKRVFQALRIEVNGELDSLDAALEKLLDQLRVGGRMVVLSYHSLEDRAVKHAFAKRSKSSAPAGLPVELPEHRPQLKLLTRGAELASDAEKLANPRAASVRLRAVEKLRAAA